MHDIPASRMSNQQLCDYIGFNWDMRWGYGYSHINLEPHFDELVSRGVYTKNQVDAPKNGSLQQGMPESLLLCVLGYYDRKSTHMIAGSITTYYSFKLTGSKTITAYVKSGIVTDISIYEH